MVTVATLVIHLALPRTALLCAQFDPATGVAACGLSLASDQSIAEIPLDGAAAEEAFGPPRHSRSGALPVDAGGLSGNVVAEGSVVRSSPAGHRLLTPRQRYRRLTIAGSVLVTLSGVLEAGALMSLVPYLSARDTSRSSPWGGVTLATAIAGALVGAVGGVLLLERPVPAEMDVE